MIRQGTSEDIDALRFAKLATGQVTHRNCGRIIYTLIRDAYVCQGCQLTWDRIKVFGEPRHVRDRGGNIVRAAKPASYNAVGPQIDVEE